MLSLAGLVGKIVIVLNTIDRKPNLNKMRAERQPAVERSDLYPHLLASTNGLSPFVFHGAIAAAIEIRILREMIESGGRAIEAPGDKMPAIVRCPAIWPARGQLRRAGTGLGRFEGQLAGCTPRPPPAIDAIVIAIAGDALPSLPRARFWRPQSRPLGVAIEGVVAIGRFPEGRGGLRFVVGTLGFGRPKLPVAPPPPKLPPPGRKLLRSEPPKYLPVPAKVKRPSSGSCQGLNFTSACGETDEHRTSRPVRRYASKENSGSHWRPCSIGCCISTSCKPSPYSKMRNKSRTEIHSVRCRLNESAAMRAERGWCARVDSNHWPQD